MLFNYLGEGKCYLVMWQNFGWPLYNCNKKLTSTRSNCHIDLFIFACNSQQAFQLRIVGTDP